MRQKCRVFLGVKCRDIGCQRIWSLLGVDLGIRVMKMQENRVLGNRGVMWRGYRNRNVVDIWVLECCCEDLGLGCKGECVGVRECGENRVYGNVGIQGCVGISVYGVQGVLWKCRDIGCQEQGQGVQGIKIESCGVGCVWCQELLCRELGCQEQGLRGQD